MKLLIVSSLAVATAAVAFAGHDSIDSHADCCATQTWAPSPLAFIKNANPPAPGAVTGTLKGMVQFDGEKPEIEPLEITPDKSVGCVESGTVDNTNRSVLVGEKGGLANVVITVQMDGAEIEVPEEPIELDQRSCRFEPHVLCIPVGATVAFLNSDKVSHNVHTYPKKNTAMNKTIPAGAQAEAKLDKTDQIQIKCDIHPWMNSWLIVTDTPYMAVSDEDGSFSVGDLEPGEYSVEWWHETLGKGKEKITVAEDGSVDALEIKVSAEEKSSGGGRRRR